MKLCVYTICKNEINNIDKWLECMKEADYMLLVDTGSTDGTYEKLLKLKSIYTNLIVEQIQFTSYFRFDEARNKAITFIPKDTKICISMDVDESFNGKGWSKFLKDNWKEEYELGTLLYLDNKENNIFNKRTIVPRTKIHTLNAFWKYPLHEVLVTNKKDKVSGESLDISKHFHLWNVNVRDINWYNLIVIHNSHIAYKSNYVSLANIRCQEEQDILSDNIKVMELFKNKKYDECLAFIKEIEQKDYYKDRLSQKIMSKSLINFYKGYIYENDKRQLSLAIKFYNKSLEEGAVNYSSMYQLTKIYYKLGQNQKIIALLQSCVENWKNTYYGKYVTKYDKLNNFFKEEFFKYYNLCK